MKSSLLFLLVLTLVFVSNKTTQLFAGELPEYTLKRTTAPIRIDGVLDEEDWKAAQPVGNFKFQWYKSGKKEQTEAKMLWDDEYLYVSYVCQDAHISATRLTRGSSVWYDDCVEVFIAPNPDDPQNYFNREMNVNGAFLEGHHPRGINTKSKERWRAHGIQIATKMVGTLSDDSDEDSHWVLEVAVPLSAYAKVAKDVPPKPGQIWHLNLNRCGGKTNEQYSQWSPSQTDEPAFHIPVAFGKVNFSDKAVR